MELKYYAFISYNSKDTEWGKRLQRKLEHYRMPSTLCRERGWKRTPIRPVFFAPTDIQPGALSDELKDRLRSSQHLIVICSPNSAKSKWVGEEIAFFHSLGRGNNIHFFIVDGTPNSGNSETECFNPVVGELNIPEILGANIHEKIYRYPWLNKERAYVQLISKLLGVEYDSIWQRHRRLLIRKMIGGIFTVVSVLLVIIGVWCMSQPVDISVKLNEASVLNGNLPFLKDAEVRLFIGNEVKTDTVSSLDDCIIFSNVPHAFYGKHMRMAVRCRDYKDLDTVVLLNENMQLDIYRDPSVYGNVSFVLWNSNFGAPVPNVEIKIGGRNSISDKNGRCSFIIPLDEQQTKYKLESVIPLENDTVYMPCGEDYVVLVR